MSVPVGAVGSGIAEDETLDGVLGGAVRVVQARKGYRFSVDAVLLARFAAQWPAPRALDLGCGCGVVGLSLLALGGADELVGVDVQEAMVDRARRSAAWNGWAHRCRFEAADLSGDRWTPGGQVGLAVANPPYYPLGTGRVSPDPATAIARHEGAGSVADVARAAGRALAPGGSLCVVFPASRVAELLEQCRRAGLEPRTARFVHPTTAAPASLVLLRCVRGAKEGLEVRAPLILHGKGRRYSPEAERWLGPP
ncbi:MAG: methyltransferase [Deferrisomatales bacterium]